MGFFKDLRNVQKQAKDMTPPEYRGMGGLMRMSKDGMAQMSQTMGQMQADAQKAQHLSVNGRPGTATITGLRQTGTFVNENPEVEMDLMVSVEGMEPYATTHRQVIAMIASAQFQPGATVPVKVDPAEPTSLIVA
ncbi:MAG TPA: hypothetical protein VHF89_08300 [Solirubrobacteraceae bacterium]|nr:hypothetical protein [Solirubrobacteraceae bacterium]